MIENQLKCQMESFYAETDVYYQKLIARFQLLENTRLKVDFIDIFELAKKHQKVLDCGCGSGSMCIYLSKQLNKKMYGADISKTGIELACSLAKKVNAECEFKVGDVENHIPFADNFFDLVIMHEVLEHLPCPDKAIQEVARVLKKNGLFVLITPNILLRSSLFRVEKKAFQWVKMIFDNQYLPKTLIDPKLDRPLKADADAVYLTNPIEIRRMLKNSDFNIVRGSFLIRCLFIAQKRSSTSK
jgi:ubiquinone/menaquinone biosynthesis C-methylase UbiE